MDLQDFKDDLAIEAHGMTVAEAHAKGVCINCEQPPTFYSEDGKGEYQISGLCEPCFDSITAEPETLSPEDFYELWVKCGGHETPFLHDDAMEFASAYGCIALGTRCPESVLEVKIAEMMQTNGTDA